MNDLMKGRKGAGETQPPAELESRPGDVELPWQLFKVIRRIDRVSDKILQTSPGTLRLRRYREGEPICVQGEQGWTAFLILTDADVQAMHALIDGLPGEVEKANRAQAEAAAQAETEADPKKQDAVWKAVEKHREAAAQKAELLAALSPLKPRLPAATEAAGPAAAVFVDSSHQQAAAPGLLGWLFGSRAARRRPRVINIDAPVSVDYGTRKATLPEGALFGEWSCLYGTPRSATIVATRDCHVVEMLRNILDFVLKDPTYQAEVRENYVRNILNNHLAGLSFLADLRPEELAEVRQWVELKSYRDGQVIFDRGDPSDCLYIVRRGLVKVLLNDWPLLTADDVRDLGKLAPLSAGGAGSVLAGRLDGPMPTDRAGVARWLNTGLKRRDFTTQPGEKTRKDEPAAALRPILDAPAFRAALAAQFPARADDWSDQDWRRYNRLVLESVCPGALRGLVREGGVDEVRRSGSENILTYMTQGDFFGEIGAVSGEPRSATCIAYVHPRPGVGEEVDPTGEKWRKEEERIELVRLPREKLLELMERHPSVRRKIEAEIKARRERSRQRSQSRGWEDRTPMQQSDRFQELGLVQGQKLMLIDLDRCTRCDECVRACVDTHDDGRTRLFLDGPRFGRYLIPVSCRACRDPVCMIGCPVGSIRRGNNLEMVIEDWCIGCQLCARNCPYGSIQMHDLGLLPQEGHGWQVRGTGRWQDVRLPLLCDADLEAMLALLGGRSLEVRRDFDLSAAQVSGAEGGLKLVIDTNDERVKLEGTGRNARVAGFVPVAINGQEVRADQWKVEREQYVLEITGAERSRWLRKGRNTLTVQVKAGQGRGGMLLQVAVDEVRSSGAVIPLRAVVCDQCSSLPGQSPACVHACPHDAAKRVDAWGDPAVW